MWFLRWLSKEHSNQMFLLKEGIQKIGRSKDCEIVLPHKSISKKHAEIELKENKVSVNDLNSKNGIIVNGHRVKNTLLKSGDKILIHDIILELVSIHEQSSFKKGVTDGPSSSLTHFVPPSTENGRNASLEHSTNPYKGTPGSSMEAHFPVTGDKNLEAEIKKEGEDQKENLKKERSLFSSFSEYINRAFLPGIYKLVDWIGFKGAIGILILIFIFCFTFFSFFPIVHFFQSKSLEEGKLRALTVAKSVATLNKEAILNEMASRINISIAESEKGVERVLIVSSKTGLILSPPLLAGRYSKIPFLNADIKKNTKSVYMTKDHQVIARFPINEYDPEINILKPVAQSAVIYNVKNFKIKDEQKISIFIQSFLISIMAGLFLHFLIVKLSGYPIEGVNKQLDSVLKNQNTNIEISYQYPVMEKLVANLNSALNRITHKEDSLESSSDLSADRMQEMDHLVQLMEWMGFPACTVLGAENKFAAVNKEFAEKTNSDPSNLAQNFVDEVQDQALKLSLLDLIERVKNQSEQLPTNELEIGGTKHNITAQSIFGSDQIAYILIVLLPEYGDEGLDEENQLDSATNDDDLESA